MIAEVIPETKTWHETEIFSYIVPKSLDSSIVVGSIVQIQFGQRKMRGVVNNISSKSNPGYELKELSGADPNFVLPAKYIDLARFISERYFCSLGEAISLFLPPAMKKPRAFSVHSTKSTVRSKARTTLTLNQNKIFNEINQKLKTKTYYSALIHGVTGSGKTEIYIKLAQSAIADKKSVIILVPEIMLTPQTVERFEKVFGENICLMHSGLSKSERFHCYRDFYSGNKKIIIGPRSALLVPNENIGLIIVDEEQEDSYKQDMSPRYHAVALAKQIAQKSGALLVLGSATPRIETFWKTRTGNIGLFELKERYGNNLPDSAVIDLKDEIKYDNFSPISRVLQEQISSVLKNKRQILLFLNRRGNATFVSCRDCGYVILCHNCSIPMVYHTNSENNYLNCHHCGEKLEMPSHCPECGGARIKFFGTGIEKVETEIRKLFPEARIAKVDSSTITKKSDYDEFYKKFKNHELDIVIGTQMIAKGLDIPAVDLVGVVSADTGLHLPHYLASEKSFSLITQVSGRSGRKDTPGNTILQTYWPESQSIIAAAKHDYKLFYTSEIAEREKHNYPPFCQIIRVISEEKGQDRAKSSLSDLKTDLRDAGFTFIGPGPCFYSRLRGKYRYHIIIKLVPDQNQQKIAKLAKKYQHLIWDIDPVNLL